MARASCFDVAPLTNQCKLYWYDADGVITTINELVITWKSLPSLASVCLACRTWHSTQVFSPLTFSDYISKKRACNFCQKAVLCSLFIYFCYSIFFIFVSGILGPSASSKAMIAVQETAWALAEYGACGIARVDHLSSVAMHCGKHLKIFKRKIAMRSNK